LSKGIAVPPTEVTADVEDVTTWSNLGAAEVHVVPLDVSTLPVVPGATNLTGLVPSPRITLSAVSADTPVPPSATVRSVMPVIVPLVIVALAPVITGLVSVLLVRVAVAVLSATSAAVTKAVVAT